MIQKIEQTTEEQISMYLELPKQKLAEMLVEANRHLSMRQPKVNPFINLDSPSIFKCSCMHPTTNCFSGKCGICGMSKGQ